eukprot:2363043-Rhodomonas_salina.1
MRARYAESGTEMGHAADTGIELLSGALRGYLLPLVRRACYAVSGTDMQDAAIVLCARYAVSGTDTGYAATRRCFVDPTEGANTFTPVRCAVPGTDI